MDAEDAFRGRAIGLWLFVNVGGNALGAFSLGTLADLTNIRAALITTGALGTAAAAITAARLLRNPSETRVECDKPRRTDCSG